MQDQHSPSLHLPCHSLTSAPLPPNTTCAPALAWSARSEAHAPTEALAKAKAPARLNLPNSVSVELQEAPVSMVGHRAVIRGVFGARDWLGTMGKNW